MIKYTSLKDDHRKILRDIIPLAKPFTLLIEPSSMCNFRCRMCFQNAAQENFKNKRMNMSLEMFNDIIEQMKSWQGDKLKVLKLCIYGEPFFNKDFIKMLKIAKESNIAERIETTSNVSLLTKDVAKGLIENGLDYLRVSIYSALDDKHQEITNTKILPKVIHENLLQLKKLKESMHSLKPFVAVKMLDTYNEEENNAFKNMYKDVADELYIDQPHSWVEINDEKFINRLYKDDMKKVKRNITSQYACPMPFTTLAVRSNGDVSPCCVDWYGGTNIGTIKNQTLKEIWQGSKLYDFRVMQLEKRNYENISCKGCSVYKSSYYTRDNIDGVPIDKLGERPCK